MTIHHFREFLYGMGLLVVLGSPGALIAQQAQKARPVGQSPRFTVQDLGTLGGPYSFSYNMNDAGMVAMGAATAIQNGDPSQAVVNAQQTAALWSHGRLLNLGTLGGQNSAAAAVNGSKLVAIDSETAVMSRQGADVCGFGTRLQCLAGLWKNGKLSALPLLPGGNNAYVLDINEAGKVVGLSDTDIYDLDCAATSTAGYRFQPAVWGPNGKVSSLALLGEDTVGFAFGINNRGQVVGASGTCLNTTPPPYVSAPHAVLWEKDGTAIDLGSFGGANSIANSINDHGDVSGTAYLPDGTPRPFLWTPESRSLRQLVPPAAFPIAIAPCCKTLNDRREVVGFMLNESFDSRAFLWKDGVMVDLNELLPNSSEWVLQGAYSINASGQIAGSGLIHGEVHAFLATPCHTHPGRGDCCDDEDR